MVKLLKQMLYIEAKDKEFLLANITRVTQNNGILENSPFFLFICRALSKIILSFRVVARRLRKRNTASECF